MAKKGEKAQIVEDLKDRMSRARSAVLTDYRGLTVAESTLLRKRLRDAGVDFKVIKNTLLTRAANDLGFEGMDAFLKGPTAVAFSYEDPVIAAKMLLTFIKEAKKMEIKGGLLEGKVLGADAMKQVADLPSREVLLAQVISGAMSPLYGLMSVASAPLRNLVYATVALKELRESQS